MSKQPENIPENIGNFRRVSDSDRNQGIAQAAAAYASAEQSAAIAALREWKDGHEKLCTERWTQCNQKLNAMIALSTTAMVGALGTLIVFWVQHAGH